MPRRRGFLFRIVGRDEMSPAVRTVQDALTRFGAGAAHVLGSVSSTSVRAATKLAGLASAAAFAAAAFREAVAAGEAHVRVLRSVAESSDLAVEEVAGLVFAARAAGREFDSLDAAMAGLSGPDLARMEQFIEDVRTVADQQISLEVDEARLDQAVDEINTKFARIKSPIAEFFAELKAWVAEFAVDQLTVDVSEPDRRSVGESAGETRVRDGIIERKVVVGYERDGRGVKPVYGWVTVDFEAAEGLFAGQGAGIPEHVQSLMDQLGITSQQFIEMNLLAHDLDMTFDEFAAGTAALAAQFDLAHDAAVKLYAQLQSIDEFYEGAANWNESFRSRQAAAGYDEQGRPLGQGIRERISQAQGGIYADTGSPGQLNLPPGTTSEGLESYGRDRVTYTTVVTIDGQVIADTYDTTGVRYGDTPDDADSFNVYKNAALGGN